MFAVYKNFTAQDIAKVPFNAHKQYNYNSASAGLNQVTYHQAMWTSESIDIYSSGALNGVYPSQDTLGTIRYQQLDHLFYRDLKFNLGSKLGNIPYLKQHRELYERVNILSIPSGLVGSGIKPGSFYLSSSIYEIVDDTYGNLYISGSDLGAYETDPRACVFRIGASRKFKKYDLNTITEESQAGIWWRRGRKRVNTMTGYTTPHDIDEYDDSYYNNLIEYHNISFANQYLLDLAVKPYAAPPYTRGHLAAKTSNAVYFPLSNNAYIKASNNKNFHFNKGDDFTISFWPTYIDFTTSPIPNKVYYFSKSTTETVVNSPNSGQASVYKTSTTGALQYTDVNSAPQFPFEIYIKDDSVGEPHIFFDRYDGRTLTSYSASYNTSSANAQQYSFRCSASQMEIFHNGLGSGISGSDLSEYETQNNANIYIGCKGGKSNFIPYGAICELNVYNKALTDTQIYNHYSSSNGSPYVGNIFYESGIATITKPQHLVILSGSSANSQGNIHQLKFKGTHLIYENEYQCTVEDHEFNDTLNISARKLRNSECPDVADFVTGSLWKPYVTTIGLYDENHDLLVVGKLGQPVKMSDETDTTFVIRWDT